MGRPSFKGSLRVCQIGTIRIRVIIDEYIVRQQRPLGSRERIIGRE